MEEISKSYGIVVSAMRSREKGSGLEASASQGLLGGAGRGGVF